MTTRDLLLLSLSLLGCQRAPARDVIAGTPADASVEETHASNDAAPKEETSAADAAATATSDDAAPPPPKRDPRCPAKMRVAEGTSCTGEVGSCEYDDGYCGCAQGKQCSGAHPPPSPGPTPGKWACNPNDQKAVRADGCPFLLVPGIACNQKGRVCTYPTCPWERQSAICDGKKWIPKLEQLGSPAP